VTIALDATPLSVSTGGVARYTLELARALAARFPADEHWLLSDQPFPMPEHAPRNLHRGDPPRNRIGRKWWLWGLQQEMMRRRIDLFHGTDFSVPYLPSRPSVMTVHDLSPWLDRSWQPHSKRLRRRTALLLRAGLATMVITPSEAIRRAVIDRFSLAVDRVIAVPLAASDHFRPIACAPPQRPYFLFVGTLEPRKNLSLLVDAWREVRKTYPVDLILAGRTRADFTPLPAEPGLQIPGPIAEEDLPALYSGALALVYPSLYEGFGLPVLEAMQCGTLVITSRARRGLVRYRQRLLGFCVSSRARPGARTIFFLAPHCRTYTRGLRRRHPRFPKITPYSRSIAAFTPSSTSRKSAGATLPILLVNLVEHSMAEYVASAGNRPGAI
jgi:glycosyltransferase involved in cell wall biosynthesis